MLTPWFFSVPMMPNRMDASFPLKDAVGSSIIRSSELQTGAYTKDSGQILWKGQEVEIGSLKDCQALGMACIFLEPADSSTTFPIIVWMTSFGTISSFYKYEFPLQATDTVDSLGIGLRQLVEILKGLSCNSELLIMDEPIRPPKPTISPFRTSKLTSSKKPFRVSPSTFKTASFVLQELDMCRKIIEKIDIRPADPEKQVGLMSGGNQQKVVIGKCS